jgi:hypothetical protein
MLIVSLSGFVAVIIYHTQTNKQTNNHQRNASALTFNDDIMLQSTIITL